MGKGSERWRNCALLTVRTRRILFRKPLEAGQCFTRDLPFRFTRVIVSKVSVKLDGIVHAAIRFCPASRVEDLSRGHLRRCVHLSFP